MTAVVQLLSRVSLCDPMDSSTPGFPALHYLPEVAQTHIHWVGDAIQPSHPLLYLLLLPSIFPSIRVFSNESVLCIRYWKKYWPKYWNFSFSISPSNEYSALISFRIDWFDLHEVQGTLKSLLQYRSSKASILWHSAFFMVQLSHPHMATGRTIALTRWTFDGKVMPLLFNMLSRLVIAFLPMIIHIQFSSVAQSCLTVWPHALQHARLPCPSPTPRTCSNSCPLSWWCHPTISSSVIHSLPAFNLSQLW